MGLFGGPRRVAPQDAEDRSLMLPPAWTLTQQHDFASIDPASGETSMQSVAVHATADLICSLASELPIDVFTDKDGRRRQVPMPGNLADPGGDGSGVEDWIYRVVFSWLLRGNLFGRETSWDRRGRSTHVDLHHPDDVTVTVEDGRPSWWVAGKPVTDPATFVHRRVNPVPGRVLGLSVVALHASTIGVSLSSTRFGEQWFKDGAHPGGLLTNEAALTAEQSKTAKERFLASTRGTREPLVLGKGWSYQAIQVSPSESQFLETAGLSEAQCARMFGPGFAEVLGYDSGGSMTYSNVVERRSDLLVMGMNKWLRRVDRLLGELVPPTQYVRLNRDALMESTTIARYQAHGLALRDRWRTVNEVRAIEDLEPVAWGDVPNEPRNGEVSGADPGRS